MGIGMLYQDPLDIPAFNVKDNYLLGRGGNILLDYKKASQELQAIMARFGFELDLEASIENLSLGERQQLELERQAFRIDAPAGARRRQSIDPGLAQAG